MSEKHEHKSGGNAFMWGMIIGGLLVYLLTSKRGKKILQQLSEVGLEALENISNVEETDEYVDEDTEEESPETVEEVSTNGNGDNRPRRFFKGIKKRV